VIGRYNNDLANSLGNLLNRALNMSSRYCNSILGNREINDVQLRKWSERGGTELRADYATKMDASEIDAALVKVFAFSTFCNVGVEEFAPWKLAKDPDKKALLEGVLYHLAESLRIIAILVSPVLPKAAHGIFDQLNWKMELSGKDERFRLDDAKWGGLPDGHVVGEPVPLFPRIEDKL
jgi:methionyl-tRNA synthetase